MTTDDQRHDTTLPAIHHHVDGATYHTFQPPVPLLEGARCEGCEAEHHPHRQPAYVVGAHIWRHDDRLHRAYVVCGRGHEITSTSNNMGAVLESMAAAGILSHNRARAYPPISAATAEQLGRSLRALRTPPASAAPEPRAGREITADAVREAPLVTVEWEDTTCNAGWHDLDDLRAFIEGVYWVEQAGYLVYQDEECVVLAGRRTMDGEHVGLLERIPRRAIRRGPV